MRSLYLALAFLAVSCGGGSSAGPGSSDGGEVSRDGGSHDASADAAAPVVDVSVDATNPGPALPASFLGISVEWSAVPAYLGDGKGGVKPQVVQLLQNFVPEGHDILVRVGGNSTDAAWWDPTNVPPPANAKVPLTINITQQYLDTLGALHRALPGTQHILGLNLALGDATNASALVTAARTLPGGTVIGFELGNEPDDWHSNGLRATTYTYADYRQELDQFYSGLPAAPSAGPTYTAPALSSSSWLPDLDGFITHEKGKIAMITTHRYPYSVCHGKAAPAPVDLLSEDATTTKYATLYHAHVIASHDANMRYRMAEMNSVSCGGAAGVSDTYVSALWGADVAFELASIDADGLNFHTPANYAVFDFDKTGKLAVKPLYYGMRFFSLATSGTPKRLPTTVANSAGLPRVHAWSYLAGDGTVRVAIFNLDTARAASVHVHLAGKSRGSLTSLVGASIDAKTGIALAGQTWDGSTDGKPSGTAQTEDAIADGDGFTVPAPSLSAVILTATP